MRASARKKSLFIKIAVIALVIYAAVSIIQLQLQIRDSQQQLDSLTARLDAQASTNEELQEQIDNYELYLEQQARKQGMAKPGETVFIEIPAE